MTTPNGASAIDKLLTIAEVERETGIRQATLRMWEKRYGFPQPLRNSHGDRVYPSGQVERLHAVRRLLDQGIRPGKLFYAGATEASLQAAAHGAPAGLAELPAACLPVLALLRNWQRAELHSLLQFRLLDLGLRRFVIEFLAPLSEAVGLAWSRGELPVRCEHFFAQAAMAVLHAKQAAVRGGGGRPRVLLAAPAGEAHVLGIMMAEAVMTTLGMQCLQLGSDMPMVEVAAAAREAQADIVALSISASFPRKNLLRVVAALRADIPAGTQVWVGGAGAASFGAHMPGVELIHALQAIEPALARWRARNDG